MSTMCGTSGNASLAVAPLKLPFALRSSGTASIRPATTVRCAAWVMMDVAIELINAFTRDEKMTQVDGGQNGLPVYISPTSHCFVLASKNTVFNYAVDLKAKKHDS